VDGRESPADLTVDVLMSDTSFSRSTASPHQAFETPGLGLGSSLSSVDCAIPYTASICSASATKTSSDPMFSSMIEVDRSWSILGSAISIRMVTG